MSLLKMILAIVFLYLCSTIQSRTVKCFPYRKEINITNVDSGPLTTQDVMISVDTQTLISSGKLKNCTMLRFCDVTTCFKFWVETSCNLPKTKIWLTLPTLAVNSWKIIDMFYGCNDTSTLDNEGQRELFAGNFLVLSKTACTGKWSEYVPAGKPPFLTIFSSSLYFDGNHEGHTHSLTVLAEVDKNDAYKSINEFGGTANFDFTKWTDSHSFPAITTQPAWPSAKPPYLDMILCKSSQFDIFTQSVHPFENGNVATGFTSFGPLNDDERYPRVASSYGGTGGNLTHRHNFTKVVSLETGDENTALGVNAFSGMERIMEKNHHHTIWGVTDEQTNLPNTITMIFNEVTGAVDDHIPNLYAFMDATPPKGWTHINTWDASGNFIKGSTTAKTTTACPVTIDLHGCEVEQEAMAGCPQDWCADGNDIVAPPLGYFWKDQHLHNWKDLVNQVGTAAHPSELSRLAVVLHQRVVNKISYTIGNELTSCFGKLSTAEDVCTGHGECTKLNYCHCNSSWYGEECDVTKCFDVFSNRTSSCTDQDPCVCSGHGTCQDIDTCKCNTNWGSPKGQEKNCSVVKCYGTLATEHSVCSSHGDCKGENNCKCESGWDTPLDAAERNCSHAKCFGIFSFNTSHVCRGHGQCQKPDQCSCKNNNYYLPDCDWNCQGNWRNNTGTDPTKHVCSGHGKCTSADVCKCDGPNYSGPFCEFKCDNIFFNNTNVGVRSVCNQHGVCEDFNKCKCSNDVKYPGEFCEYKCGQYFNNQTGMGKVCEGHGTCDDVDKCSCESNYPGFLCEWKCKGIWKNVSESDPLKDVCSGHGECTDYNKCTCNPGGADYPGLFCEFKCDGIFFNNTNVGVRSVCNQHGTCSDADKCDCTNDVNYPGRFCEYKCGEWFNNQTAAGEVCEGHGTCDDVNKCSCDGDYPGRFCEWKCDGIWKNATKTGDPLKDVCSGHGQCTKHETCSCSDTPYKLPYCKYKCNGLWHDNVTHVCNGHGTCDLPDKCGCKTNYPGLWCEWKCGNIWKNETTKVCKNRGPCEDYETCKCPPNYDGKYCEWKCGSKWYNETGNANKNDDVCNGHGNCDNYNDCKCTNNTEYDPASFCKWKCGDVAYDNGACNGHGSCKSVQNCECEDDTLYPGKECQWKCDGIWKSGNALDVGCKNHGKCTDSDYCTCNDNYPGKYCEWKCDGVWSNASAELLCNGHGQCNGHDTCGCQTGSYLPADFCSFKCGDLDWKADNVCHGHGKCKDINTCECKNTNYDIGSFCSFKCNAIAPGPTACNGRGKCVDHNFCICNEPTKYTGSDCEMWECDGKNKTDTTVCEGHGKCDKPGTCTCDFGYNGDDCALPGTIIGMSVGGGVAAAAGGLVLLICILCCLAIIAVLCAMLIAKKKKEAAEQEEEKEKEMDDALSLI